MSLLMLDGTIRIEGLDAPVKRGDSLLIAAGSKDVTLTGTGRFIATVVE